MVFAIVIAAAFTAAGIVSGMMLRAIQHTRDALSRKMSYKDETWENIGKIKNILIRPLMHGKEYQIASCTIEKNEIKVVSDNQVTLRDRMFVIYDEETKCVQTTTNFAELTMIDIKCVKNSRNVEFRFDINPALIVDLNKEHLKKHSVECKAFYPSNETLYFLKCHDLGKKAAKWISRVLVQNDFGYRLAYNKNNVLRNIHLWDSFSPFSEIKEKTRSANQKRKPKLFGTQSTKKLGSDMPEPPHCILASETTMKSLNMTSLYKMNSQKLAANIIVELSDAYKECEYEYFKYQEGPIIKNLQPWKGPPLESITMPNELRKNLLPIHCEIELNGILNVGDTLYGIKYKASSTELVEQVPTSFNITRLLPNIISRRLSTPESESPVAGPSGMQRQVTFVEDSRDDDDDDDDDDNMKRLIR